MPSRKATPKNSFITLTLNKKRLLRVGIIIIALAIGFGGGILYQNHKDNAARNVDPTITCNCPNTQMRYMALSRCQC